jgi:hypothetical protein
VRGHQEIAQVVVTIELEQNGNLSNAA